MWILSLESVTLRNESSQDVNIKYLKHRSAVVKKLRSHCVRNYNNVLQGVI